MAVGFMVRVGDAGLHRRVKVRAAEEGQTMGAWVRAAIETQLEVKRVKASRPVVNPAAEAAVPDGVIGSTERTCRKCGHPEGKHRLACILMGCVCQRFGE